jgi:surface antigen
MSCRLRYSLTAVLLTLMGITTLVSASNVQWLRDTAMSNMTEQDMEILRSAARNVLNYGPDGESKRWENKETGAKGILTPLDSFEQNDQFCRRLEAFNEVGGASGRSVFVFCRQEDGEWLISSTPR